MVLRGLMDRVEIDADGQVLVVDLKTSKTPPTAGKVAEHVQLGVYQTAVQQGAVEGRSVSGGAELVQLRNDAKGLPAPLWSRRRSRSLPTTPPTPTVRG